VSSCKGALRHGLPGNSNGFAIHPQEEAFRAEVQTFLKEKLPKHISPRSRPASA
jgi:hypothetical protein